MTTTVADIVYTSSAPRFEMMMMILLTTYLYMRGRSYLRSVHRTIPSNIVVYTTHHPYAPTLLWGRSVVCIYVLMCVWSRPNPALAWAGKYSK